MSPSAQAAPGDPQLFRLRPDIEIHPGPPRPDGAPTFTVHDPLNRTFDKIGWAEAIILANLRLAGTLSGLMRLLEERTTLRLPPGEVLAFCREAAAKGLTMGNPVKSPAQLMAVYENTKTRVMRWLLHHYLYFRIPLIRPDAFLARTLPRVRLLASRPVLTAVCLLSLAGALMCLERLPQYLSTFSYFFSLEGLFTFGLTVTVIKIAHEFSHAYTAKALGLRVPVMGVAFIVLWPVAFCDVTDAWKIADRKKRLAITAAGALTELAIAGLALLGWAVTKPGVANSVFFVISSSSALSTLLVNVNPAMRFDGYFLLMDLWGIDNLQPRAFALTRWFFRKWILGLDDPSPEPEITGRRQAMVIAYSLYAWLYRLGLYLGIAVLVYEKCVKILGIFLFCVEVWWFVWQPLWREAVAWYRARGKVRRNARNLTWLAAACLLVLFAALPLPRRLALPAALVPAQSQAVYSPFAGRITDIAAGPGARVEKGATVAAIKTDKLDEEIAVARLELLILEKRRELMILDERDKAFLPQQDEEIEAAQARLAALNGQREQSRLIAEVSGRMVAWDDTLRNGMPMARHHLIGKLASLDDMELAAFVREELTADIAPGDRVKFFTDAGDGPFSGSVVSVLPVRAETMEHLALTSAAKGSLPVLRQEKGRFVMLESHYLVKVAFDEKITGQPLGVSGQAWLSSRPRSLLVDWARHATRVLIREITF